MATIPIYGIDLFKEGELDCPQKIIRNPQAAAEYFTSLISDMDREHCAVLMLSEKNKPIGINIVSIGTIDTAIVHPREVFKAAILTNASSIIVGHNHPSGSLNPSQHDKHLTLRLLKCGDRLGIKLQDHIIVNSERNYTSFIEIGYLDPMEIVGKVKETEDVYSIGEMITGAKATVANQKKESPRGPNAQRKEAR